MEKMFGPKMRVFMSGMSEEEKQNWISRFEKMAAICPCVDRKDMTEEDKKKMRKKMMSCCGGMMEMMTDRFKRNDPQSAETGSSNRA